MANLHNDVLVLIETLSLNRNDYENSWDMYMDANEDREIDMLMDEHIYHTRDELVEWVCTGYLDYLDMACAEDAEDDELILLKDAHMLYLQYVAYNAVVYAFFNV